jgi:hypothetical protein
MYQLITKNLTYHDFGWAKIRSLPSQVLINKSFLCIEKINATYPNRPAITGLLI